jgi:hypothetical protein
MADDNPFVDMGLLSMMQPNPYIDPAFRSKPLQLPGFRGVATNAAGKPIQSDIDAIAASQAPSSAPPPGTTTLNTPGPGAPAPAAANYSGLGQWGPAVSQLENSYLATPGGSAAASNPNAALISYIQSQNRALEGAATSQNQGGFGSGNNVLSSSAQAELNSNLGQIQQLQRQGAAAPAAAPAAPPANNGVDLRQAYLDALANPGDPPIVGAKVPASNPLGTPSVLNAFLAAHPSGGSKGAGNYSNSGFFDTLNQLGKVG